MVLFQDAAASRVPSGLNAMRASSPPIDTGLIKGRPVRTFHTYTSPQKEPAARKRPLRLKVCPRQPVPHDVFPYVRSLPVRTFLPTSSACGLAGGPPGPRPPGGAGVGDVDLVDVREAARRMLGPREDGVGDRSNAPRDLVARERRLLEIRDELGVGVRRRRQDLLRKVERYACGLAICVSRDLLV